MTGTSEGPPSNLSSVMGVVLCRVGNDRFALSAKDVQLFAPVTTSVRYAGHSFDPTCTPPDEVRCLASAAGTLSVDSVVISAETFSVTPAPKLLRRRLGAEVLGFIEVDRLLWPLLSPAAFLAEGASP